MPEFERPVPGGPPEPPRRGWAAFPSAALRRLPRPVRIGLGIALAVAVVAGASVAARHTAEGERRADPPSRAAFHLSPPSRTLDLPGRVTGVDLAADGSGVAIAVDCSGYRCRAGLAVTRGTARWQARRLPAALRVTALYEAVDAVLLADLRVLVSTPSERWFSRNGGLTWDAVPDSPGAPVPRVGRGRLAVSPPSRLFRCDGSTVGVISYHTGRFAPLRRQPALHACWASPLRDPAGRRWIGGVDPATGRAAVAWSRDDGATWRVQPLPGPADQSAGAMVTWGPKAPSPGRDASRESAPSPKAPYALSLAAAYRPHVLGRALHRAAPEGAAERGTERWREMAAWHEVMRWPDANLLAVRGEIVVRPDGSLLLVSGVGAVLESDDEGASFTPAHARLRLGPVTRTAGGWVAQVQDVSYAWLRSSDGVTWRRLAVQ